MGKLHISEYFDCLNFESVKTVFNKRCKNQKLDLNIFFLKNNS